MLLAEEKAEYAAFWNHCSCYILLRPSSSLHRCTLCVLSVDIQTLNRRNCAHFLVGAATVLLEFVETEIICCCVQLNHLAEQVCQYETITLNFNIVNRTFKMVNGIVNGTIALHFKIVNRTHGHNSDHFSVYLFILWNKN